MRPGITSIGIRKEIHETITNNPGKIFSFLNCLNKNTRDVMLPHQMEDSKLWCKLRHIGSEPFRTQRLKSFHKLLGQEIGVQASVVLCLKAERAVIYLCSYLCFVHILQSVIGKEDYFKGFTQPRIKFLCFQMLTQSLTFSPSERKFPYQSEEGFRADDAKKSIFIGNFYKYFREVNSCCIPISWSFAM